MPGASGIWQPDSSTGVAADHWTGLFSLFGGHPDYPLLLGISNAITWILLRQETTRGPMALAFVFGVSITGLLFSLMYKLRDSTQAALAVIVLATQAFVIILAAAQYADLPFSCYFLASVGLVPVYLRSRQYIDRRAGRPHGRPRGVDKERGDSIANDDGHRLGVRELLDQNRISSQRLLGRPLISIDCRRFVQVISRAAKRPVWPKRQSPRARDRCRTVSALSWSAAHQHFGRRRAVPW